MKDCLNLLNEMLVEAAVHQIAVDDFEEIAGEPNEVIRADLEIEANRAKLDLLDFVLSEGRMLKLWLVTEQAELISDAPEPRMTNIVEEERHRLLTHTL